MQTFVEGSFTADIVDVPGDGNCLYHSVVASGLTEFTDHVSLRQEVQRFAMNEGNALALAVHSSLKKTSRVSNTFFKDWEWSVNGRAILKSF